MARYRITRTTGTVFPIIDNQVVNRFIATCPTQEDAERIVKALELWERCYGEESQPGRAGNDVVSRETAGG